MTKVIVTRKNNKIISFSCDGHTDYGEEGEDIVCAALSSITQTAVLGLMQVAHLPIDYKVDHKNATLSVVLPDKLDAEDRINADMILETMYLGIADLSAEYGRFIQLTNKKE